jgi:hypothetical protein
MTVEAKVVCHSISPEAIPIATVQIKQPRIIHSEFMTHRALSKNASSSRAIPTERMLKNILEDPARPVRFGANQKGMQDKGGDHREPVMFCNPFTGALISMPPEDAWDYGLHLMSSISQGFADAGYHKQIANRLVEPWSHISLVVTATEWDNFFMLRDHPDADPTIHAVAAAVKDALRESSPKLIKQGQWHLPYIHEDEKGGSIALADLIKMSVARCARVSYLNHDGGNPSMEEDINLYTRLMGSQPFHATPSEHQATPDRYAPFVANGYMTKKWENPHEHGNLYGWRQYRKMISGENGGTRRARF